MSKKFSFQNKLSTEQIYQMITNQKVRPLPRLPLNTLTSWLGGELVEVINPSKYTPINGVNIDTRSLLITEQVQEAFLTIDGKHYQGLDLIPIAFNQGGRVFIISNRYYSDLDQLRQSPNKNTDIKQSSCFIVVHNTEITYQIIAKHFLKRMGGFRLAITGSAGKTTTKEVLATVLSGHYGVFCNYKNENNLIGVPKNIFTLQKKLLNKELSTVHILIFEIGMSVRGEIGALAEIVSPHLAVITNILYSHIGNFSHRDDIVHAKGEVIEHLSTYSTYSADLDRNGQNKAINPCLYLPTDVYGKSLFIKKANQCSTLVEIKEVSNLITTTLQLTTTDLDKKHIDIDKSTIQTVWQDHQRKDLLVSSGIHIFSDQAVSFAIMIGEHLGIEYNEVIHEIKNNYISMNQDQGVLKNKDNASSPILIKAESRLQLIHKPNKPIVIDDSYNSNPNSLVTVVSHLLNLYNSNVNDIKIIFVIGEMLELGSFQKELYLHTINKINQQLTSLHLNSAIMQPAKEKLKNQFHDIHFFFFGEEIKVCYDNLNFDRKYFYVGKRYSSNSLNDTILPKLLQLSDQQTIVFFKASHGVNFQQLVVDFVRMV